MGTCCFAPGKRHFLWWYWLLLVSIVGIPMLLAVGYVARRDAADEEEKKARGRTAALIFWIGTLVTAVVMFVVVFVATEAVYRHGEGDVFSYFSTAASQKRAGYCTLAIHFLVALVAASAANDVTRRLRWYWRIPVFGACVFLYLVFLTACYTPLGRLWSLMWHPVIQAMQFAVCMLPAHYWGMFKDHSDSRHARKALVAFVSGATLFFVVSCFGGEIGYFLGF